MMSSTGGSEVDAEDGGTVESEDVAASATDVGFGASRRSIEGALILPDPRAEANDFGNADLTTGLADVCSAEASAG